MTFNFNYHYQFRGVGRSMATRRSSREEQVKRKKRDSQPIPPLSLIHTIGGLVQRANPASGGSGSSRGASAYDGPSLGEGGGSATAPDSDLPRQQDYDEEETGDSKSMRMTLMEEVLLLGLKDREVR